MLDSIDLLLLKSSFPLDMKLSQQKSRNNKYNVYI